MIDDIKEYLVVDYDEGTAEIVEGFNVEKEINSIRSCGNKALVTEIIYGEVVIDDSIKGKK